MKKQTLFAITNCLRPLIRKQDTHYKMFILVEVQVAYAFYKLTQGCNLLICNELFTMGWFIVSLVLKEVIIVFNVIFKHLITWPPRNKMEMVMQGFKTLCGLPSIQRAITNTHFSISKPDGAFCEDYFYHKIKRYNVDC